MVSLPRTAISQARINELHIAPASAGLEFVEIIVIGNQPVDLAALTLEDSREKPGRVVFAGSDSPIVNPGEIVVLAQNPDALREFFGQHRVVAVKPWPSLNNGGDKVVVRQDGQLLDVFVYDSDDYIRNISLERIDPHVPAEIPGNWEPSSAFLGATPGVQNSVFKPDTISVSVLLAEYSFESSIDVYFSEPVNLARLDARTVFLDHNPYTGVLTQIGLSVLRLSAAPGFLHIEFTSLEDFAGNVTHSNNLLIAQRAAPGDLLITEIMYDPGDDVHGDRLPEYVEIVNRTDAPISLANVDLVVGPPGSRSADIFPLKRSLYQLNSGQYAVVFNDANITDPGEFNPEEFNPDNFRENTRGGGAAGFSIDPFVATFVSIAGPFDSSPLWIPVRAASLSLNNSGDALRVVSEEMIGIDSVLYRTTWHDDALLNTRNRSLSRIRLEADSNDRLNWTSTLDAPGYSPGYGRQSDGLFAGIYPGPGVLSINEIMYDPRMIPEDGLPDQSEYLEVINTSHWEVDLNGTSLVSGARVLEEGTRRDTLRLAFKPVRLGAGEIAVFFRIPAFVPDGDRPAAAFLEAAFPNIKSSAGLVLLPIRSAIGLSNTGEYLEIIAGNQTVQDKLSYNTSWHHPLVSQATGKSIERIDTNSPSQQSSNWSSSAAETGGTPGTRNSIRNNSRSPTSGERLEISPQTITPGLDGDRDHARIVVRGGASNASIQIDLFDLEGRLVRKLVPMALHTGTFTTFWDGTGDGGRQLPVGIYIVLARVYDQQSNRIISFKKPIAIFRN